MAWSKKGHHGGHKGHHLSAVARAKLSAERKGKHHAGRHLSPAARAAESARMKGKHHPHKGHAISSTTRAKISEALKARHPGGPAKHVRKTSRHLSAAARAHLSALRRGKRHPHAGAGKGHTRPASRPRRHDLVKQRHGARHAQVVGRRGLHSRRGLIRSTTRHIRKGYLHTKTRHHRYRPVIRRRTRANRVWRRHRS